MSTITSRTLSRPGWVGRILRVKPTKDRVGRWGERVARRHLVAAHLLPVTTNWRSKAGELDLIALDKRTLVIIEVKTRHTSQEATYPAISAITHEKRRRLESLGRSFARNYGPFCRRYAIKARRTDVIEVYYSRTRWGRFRACKVVWHKGIPTS